MLEGEDVVMDATAVVDVVEKEGANEMRGIGLNAVVGPLVEA